MNHIDALRRVRRLLQRPAATEPGSPDAHAASFDGPTLLQQEPDLAKEAGRHAQDASAWAAGGHATD